MARQSFAPIGSPPQENECYQDLKDEKGAEINHHLMGITHFLGATVAMKSTEMPTWIHAENSDGGESQEKRRGFKTAPSYLKIERAR
ncbi:hypothetical protein IAD21_05594 [Abditibacteriota bacterium]|nr:hypothetical protein IAD21_05594 [Abditibacteriota bacterium]